MPRKTKENEELKNTKISTKSKVSTKTSTTKKIKTKNQTKKSSKSKIKKSTTKKAVSKKKEIKPTIIEYYDLPQKYNKTVVKVLAQTPNTLFVYWDISDKDRKKYLEQYGENFFEVTHPILIVHNDTYNYKIFV